MLFRLTRFRLKTEWTRIFWFLLCILIWAGVFMMQVRIPADYNSYQSYVGMAGGTAVNTALGVSETESGTVSRQEFERYLAKYRDFIYRQILMNNSVTGFLVGNALGVMLICTPLNRRKAAQLLSAGYSRLRIFLSLILAYYLVMGAIWLGASRIMCLKYPLIFAAEEREYYRVTQLSWLMLTLGRVSLCVFCAFLLRGPLKTYLTAMFIELVLLLKTDKLPGFLPSAYLRDALWQPGADLTALHRGCWVSLGCILAAVLASWLAFRKRGQE